MRGLAMLLVVLVHLQASEAQHSSDPLLPWASQFGIMGVDIFFVISGFIMVTVTQDHPYPWRSALHFLLHRLMRIYPAYWLASLALLLASVLLPITTSSPVQDIAFVLKSFLLWPQAQMPLLAVGWTLVHELFFYIVFTALLCLSTRWRSIALALWAVATVASYLHWHPPAWQPVWVVLTSPLTLEFIAGCFLAQCLQHRSLRHRPLQHRPLQHPAYVLLTGVLATAASWMHWSWTHPGTLPGEMMRVVYFLPPSLLLLAGAIGLEQRTRTLPHWLAAAGDASYSIYLTHVPCIAAMAMLWRWFAPQAGWVDNAMTVSITLGATILFGVLFSRCIEKPLLHYSRRWL